MEGEEESRGEKKKVREGKRRRKRRRRRRREREPTPFTLFASSHLVRGVPGPRKRRCRPSRGHPRHHWHCLGDLTPVLASYSDITGLFVPLVSPTHVPRTALGTTKWDDVMPARTPEDSDECRGAHTTFCEVEKRGKGTTDGNNFWPDTRDGDRTRDPRFRKPTLYPLSYASQKVY